jgi:dihydropteroate synthase-like protein
MLIKNTKIRLLLLTGLEAYTEIQTMDWSSVQTRFEIQIHPIELSIIAFLSPNQLEKELKQLQDCEFDYILVSGLISWDVSNVNSPYANKIKKGPKFIAMLPEILVNFDLELLSSKEPADKLYHNLNQQNLDRFIQNKYDLFQSDHDGECFSLSQEHPNIIFSPHFPPIVIGEIVDAPLLSLEELCNKVAYLKAQGAEIIDIGCIANADNCQFLSDLLPQLKAKFSIPFSIDSINPAEIHAAVRAGAEMVLSINPENIDELLNLPKDLPLVVIPNAFSSKQSYLTPVDRVRILMELGAKLAENGYHKIFLDPLTDAPIYPGIVPSIEALSLLHEGIQNLPEENEDGEKFQKPQLFMGACNVTELIDADSPGINAMLAVIAAELGVSAVLTNEFSNKCRKSVEELKSALLLTYYAKQQKIPPINCGYSALRLKSKQKYPIYRHYNERQVQVETHSQPAEMDSKGYFKIGINSELNYIWVTHFSNATEKMDATCTYRGTSAESLYKQIIDDQLISRFDHAAYLGKELMKAEQALKYGTEYIEE